MYDLTRQRVEFGFTFY